MNESARSNGGWSHFTRDEVVGKSMVEVFEDIQESGLLDEYNRALDTGETIDIGMYDYQDSPEETRYFNIFLVPFSDSELVIKFRNITGTVLSEFILKKEVEERKRAEDALRRHKEELECVVLERTRVLNETLEKREQQSRLLKSIVESVAEGITAVDVDGEHIISNSAARFIEDRGSSENGEKEVNKDYGIFYEDEKTPVHKNEVPLRRALDGEEVHDEVHFVRNNNLQEGAYIVINALPWRNSNNELEGAVSSFRNITKLKLTEKELQRRNDELEEFVYTVSHDLKSPLVTIKGFIGLLREDLNEGLHEEAPILVDTIERAAVKMSGLIDDLLHLSRVSRLKNDPEQINIKLLMSRLKEAYETVLVEKGITLVIEPDLPDLFGDRQAIENAFNQLLSNAIKYGSNGDDPMITFGCRHVGKELHYFVKDNGPGIDKTYQQKIFGLFQRLDPKKEGSGVGLAIASKIIRVHGGRIWVESEPGQGATFWVALPDGIEFITKK